MIRRIKYADIDFEKYEHCLGNSVQKNFYAQRHVLDFLCESWELLVAADYEYVMPVPVKRKWGFRVVIMPLFCQQLGIFGPMQNPALEKKFLQFLTAHYRISSYAFNHQNNFDGALPFKKNFFIPSTTYAQLRKNYFKGRKSTVKTAQYLNFQRIAQDEVRAFLQQNFKGLDKDSDHKKFFDYLSFLEERNLLEIYAAFKNAHITSVAVTIVTEETDFLLALVNDARFKNDNGASFLIDRLLQEHIDDRNFDFMGGNLPGIGRFFKSFGSTLQEYPVVENSKKHLIRTVFISNRR